MYSFYGRKSLYDALSCVNTFLTKIGNSIKFYILYNTNFTTAISCGIEGLRAGE